MMKILLRFIVGIIRPAACSGRLTPEQIEREELGKIARGACKYTMSYKGNELSKDYKQREYCKMHEEYFEMFFLLRKGAEECRRCEDGNTRIVKLKYLRGSDSPRKWMEYVIFYSLEKRLLEISDEVFIGIAIYSQYYNVTGINKEILIDNLFELYIKGRILCEGKDSFYSRIYTTRDDDEQELALLEELMKAVLLNVLRKYKLPFSYEDRTGNLNIYEKDPYYLEDWCKTRNLIGDSGVTSFSNVVMIRMPSYCISEDGKKILLTLIGMVRTGKNIISVRCENWLENYDFSRVLGLVNTNRNLVGVTELDSDMRIGELLGGLRGQLKYLEITFCHLIHAYARTLRFIDSLENEIALDVSLNYHLVNATIKALLGCTKVKYILNLRILDTWCCLSDSRHILGDPKIIGLELYNCSMSLEEFLLDNDYKVFRGKLRVLEVPSVGSIERITDADLELDRLHIRALYRKEKAMNLDQLVDRGITAGRYFRYLIFSDIHFTNESEVVALRNRLGAREWPVVLTNFKPPGTENTDYVYVCDCIYYELRQKSV